MIRMVGHPVAKWGGTVLAVGALAVLVVPAAARAQDVRVSTSLGVYLPLGFGGALIVEPGFEKHQIQAGVLFGRMALRVHPRLSVEGELGYGRGMVAIRDSSRARVVSDIKSALWTTNVRALYWVIPNNERRLSMYVGSGVGLLGRSGEAFVDTPAKTRGALLALAGASTILGRRNHGPSIRFELEDHITWAQFNVGLPNQTRARTVHDIIWSVGLSFRVRR